MSDISSQVIIGIDPGTRITGYGIIFFDGYTFKPIDFGCIRPPVKLSLSDRYLIIFEAIADLMEKFNPDVLVVEEQYVHENPQSAIKLGMAKAIAIIAAKKRKMPVFGYSPTKAKKAIVGNGRASKQQVQYMIQSLLKLSTIPEPEDAADALSLAICHAQACRLALHLQYQI